MPRISFQAMSGWANLKELLLNIDMIADNLDFGHGMCGSASGSIPTDVGQPTIRVQNMVVGGRGSKWWTLMN